MKHFTTWRLLVGCTTFLVTIIIGSGRSEADANAQTLLSNEETTDMYECGTQVDGSPIYCNARTKMGPDYIQCTYYIVRFAAKIEYTATKKTTVIYDGPYEGWNPDVYNTTPNFTVPEGATIVTQWAEHNSEQRLVHGQVVECESDGGSGGTCSTKRHSCSDLYLGTATE